MEVKVTGNAARVVLAGEWAKVLVRGALGALLLVLAWQAYNLRNLPGWVERQIARESEATRAAALSAIADTRKDLLGEVARARTDLMAQVTVLRTDTKEQVGALTDAVLGPEGSLKADLLARVDGLKTDLLARADAVRGDVQPLVKSTGRVLDAAAEQADLLGRCEYEDPDGTVYGNQDCIANRLIPAMKNFEHMAAAGEVAFKAVAGEAAPTAKAVRAGAEQVTGIATDIHTVTTDAVAPVPWYRKLGRVASDLLILLSHFL